MEQKDQAFAAAITGKKLPILTLDHKWHQLFTQVNVTPEIKEQKDYDSLSKEEKERNTGKQHGDPTSRGKSLTLRIAVSIAYFIRFG